jgi:5,6-dimethylbenzimidazole synthase
MRHTLLRVHAVPHFDSEFRERFRDLLIWRRDVRRFQTTPLPKGTLEELLSLACLAPSVGLSEPWRFIQVASAECRMRVRAEFQRANKDALAGYAGEQAALYSRLKLSGLDCAPIQLAVFADTATAQGAGLGRQTMSETLEYSVIGAISTLWLAARAYGLGVGWVSICSPDRVHEILSAPPGWRLIAYLCIGYPTSDNDTPELERDGWEKRNPARFSLLER